MALSQKVFTLAQISKKRAKSLPWASSLYLVSAQGGDLAPSFGEVCQTKKNLSHLYLNSKKQLCNMHLFDDGHNLLMLSLLISGGNFVEDFPLDDCQLLLNRSRMYWNLFFYLTIYQRHTCISFEEWSSINHLFCTIKRKKKL